jgi:hypothetical protein
VAFRIADHDAVDLARRSLRHVAVRDVGLYLRCIALERIAEAACRGPQHGIDVRRMLHEILLPQLQRLGAPLSSSMSLTSLRALHALQHIRVRA